MERMKNLRYTHESLTPLIVTVWRGVYRGLRRLARTSLPGRLAGTRGRRFLAAGLVVLALTVEFIMLWTLAELVELCISLMELWAELAAKHLEITLDTTA